MIGVRGTASGRGGVDRPCDGVFGFFREHAADRLLVLVNFQPVPVVIAARAALTDDTRRLVRAEISVGRSSTWSSLPSSRTETLCGSSSSYP